MAQCYMLAPDTISMGKDLFSSFDSKQLGAISGFQLRVPRP